MNEVLTRTAKIFMDTNGVIHIAILKDVHIDYLDAVDNFLVVKNLSQGRAVLKLIDSRNNWTIEDKAQKFIMSKEVRERTIARAVITNSSIKGFLMNFFTSLNKPQVPIKIFTDYKEAYEWLIKFKESDEP